MASRKPPAEGEHLHDTAKPDDGNTYGLQLTLPGAPLTPHTVMFEVRDQDDPADLGRFVALPGLYRSDNPTPVGGPGECTLEQAVAASQQPACRVELVKLGTQKHVDHLRAEHQEALDAARSATAEMVLAARRGELDGGEADRVTDELAATGQKSQES